MPTTKLGRCDYCERHSVSIRTGWIENNDSPYSIKVAIRQICIDLDSCRKNGGNPPEPEFVHDLENHGSERWIKRCNQCKQDFPVEGTVETSPLPLHDDSRIQQKNKRCAGSLSIGTPVVPVE